MPTTRGFSLLATALLLGSISLSAHATPDAVYSYSTQASQEGGPYNSSYTASWTPFSTSPLSFTSSSGLSSATTTLNSVPSVSSSANFSGGVVVGGQTPGATANGNLMYYFSIIGPTQVSVPIEVTGYESLSAGSFGEVSTAYVYLTASGGAVSNTYTCQFGAGCGSSFYSLSNTAYSVTAAQNSAGSYSGYIDIQSNANAYTNSYVCNQGPLGVCQPSGTATAYIDPYITIAPSFLASNPGYSIVVSNGISNISPAPEPETYTMLLVGLGLLGFIAYRRKDNASALRFVA